MLLYHVYIGGNLYGVLIFIILCARVRGMRALCLLAVDQMQIESWISIEALLPLYNAS